MGRVKAGGLSSGLRRDAVLDYTGKVASAGASMGALAASLRADPVSRSPRMASTGRIQASATRAYPVTVSASGRSAADINVLSATVSEAERAIVGVKAAPQ